jgi:hypothetical protein
MPAFYTAFLYGDICFIAPISCYFVPMPATKVADDVPLFVEH